MLGEQLSLDPTSHVWATVAVLVLFGAVVFLLKNGGISVRRAGREGGKSRPRLQILDRLKLTPQNSICLVEADGRRWLVSACAQGISLLESFPTDEKPTPEQPAEAPAPAPPDNSAVVKDALQKFEQARRVTQSVGFPAAAPVRPALTGAAYLE